MRYLILITLLIAFLGGCGKEERVIKIDQCKSVRFIVSPEKINGTKYCGRN